MARKPNISTLLAFASPLLAASVIGCMSDTATLDEVASSEGALFTLDDQGLPPDSLYNGPVAPPPPPDAQPPLPTDSARGYFDTTLIRFVAQIAGDGVIEEANAKIREAGAPATLRWADGARPYTECGYDCAHTPWLTYTRYPSGDNHWIVLYEVRLHFFVDMPASLGRHVYVNVPFHFRCEGWETGFGTMTVTQAAPDVWFEGGDPLESIIDFLSPWSLSRFIDEKVRENLPRSGSRSTGTIPIESPSCSSLGTVDGYPARNGWWLDAVIWDIPEPVPPTWTSDWVSRYAP
ncbi:MAG: hypothetical protein IT379_20345 [Deltaproteobacteria bacterium]|nr:hypothetical protein [Deltaproteobacteria bacterium]